MITTKRRGNTMKHMMNVTEHIRAVVKEAQIELFFKDEKIETISISPDKQ
jgi:hypothetical protein